MVNRQTGKSTDLIWSNYRFGTGLSESDFAGYMNHLGLPHPKLMDEAVPANLLCGRPEHGRSPPADPTWAPLTWTFAGLWEIHAPALEEVMREVQVIDVRDADEFTGPLGHVPGARLIPLDQWTERMAEIDRDRPVVTVCRSGTRSAQAAVLLTKAGYGEVANLAGGMLQWRSGGYPVEDAAA